MDGKTPRSLIASTVAAFALVTAFFFYEAQRPGTGTVFEDMAAAPSPGPSLDPAAVSSSDAPTMPGDEAAETSDAGDSSAPGRDGRAPDSMVIGDGRGGPGAPGSGPSVPGGNGGRSGWVAGGGPGSLLHPFAPGTSPIGTGTVVLGPNGQPINPQDQPQGPNLNDLPPGTGLLGEYWDYDAEIYHIPNMDSMPAADVTRVDPVVNFGAEEWNLTFKPLETWATRWTGYLKCLNDGAYGFTLGSDDGAILEIDNQAICGADQLQGYTESSGTATLAKGLHYVRIRYFNNRGPGLCRFFWSPPDGSGPAIVPQEDLYPAGGTAEQGMPKITAVSPQGAKTGATITITGVNFSDSPQLDKVTFGAQNVPAVVTAASATQLTVVIPNGVDQGPIALTVGAQAAPSVPYTVGGWFGLYARTWRDTSGTDVTTYEDPGTAAPPDDEQIFGPVDVSLSTWNFAFSPVRFRTCFTGQVWAQASGEHTFALASDDGSQLLIDGQKVIDDGGLHGRQQVQAKLQLNQGWHTVEIDFFQNLGDANVTLLHADPNGSLIVCPRGYLVPPPDIANRVTPVIANLNPNPANAGDRLMISGAGLAPPDGQPPVVLLNGNPLPVTAASPGSVVVEIPFGVDTGTLIVRSGPLASAPQTLTVNGYGLKAEYWQMPGQLSELPSLTSAPGLTRTDGPIDFQEDPAFKLPWASTDHFVAHWTGRLYVPSDGSYELATGSDDGSRLTVDGNVVVQNDGLHAYEEVGNTVALTQGLHNLFLEFFQNEGEARCRLLWKPPGTGGRVPVPRSSLVPPN
jgi:hypothetical protein